LISGIYVADDCGGLILDISDKNISIYTLYRRDTGQKEVDQSADTIRQIQSVKRIKN
jgi:hypothetical protein